MGAFDWLVQIAVMKNKLYKTGRTIMDLVISSDYLNRSRRGCQFIDMDIKDNPLKSRKKGSKMEAFELDPESKLETASEQTERGTTETAMTPLQIFDECFSKYFSNIGKLIGFNVLDGDYTVGPLTILSAIIFFNACIAPVLTATFADSPSNIFVLGEIGAAVQVKGTYHTYIHR